MQKINFSNQFSSFLIFTPLFDSLILIDKKKQKEKRKRKLSKIAWKNRKEKENAFVAMHISWNKKRDKIEKKRSFKAFKRCV